MKRLRLDLDDMLAVRLEALATAEGKSLATVVEELVGEGLAARARAARPADAQRVGDMTPRELATLIGVNDLEAAKAHAEQTRARALAAQVEMEMTFRDAQFVRALTPSPLKITTAPEALQLGERLARALVTNPDVHVAIGYALISDTRGAVPNVPSNPSKN